MAAHVAYDMLKRATALPATGGRCLVLGASGGLGTVLLQLLRRRDVYTAAVCSGANAETVQRLGAGEVVDYTSAPFAEQLADAEKFDVVFETVVTDWSETNRDYEC